MKPKQLTIVTLVLAILAGFHTVAAGQSDAELRRENQRLRTENEELKRELEAAKARITALESTVARLSQALQAAAQGRPVDETPDRPLEPGSVDESVPSASPRALFNALVESYRETLGETPAVGQPRTSERRQFMRSLQHWRNTVHREMRSPIEWHVRVDRAELVGANYTMQMTAIDPKNLAELGESFEITLPRSQARLYEQRVEQGEPGLFVLRGILVHNVNINEDRFAPGPFDRPRFIGPMAEFGFTIEPRMFLPAEDEKSE